MTRYVLKRLVLLPALLFMFSVAVFAIVQAPPGDFLTTYVARLASSGSSINGMKFAAPRLAHAITRDLFRADVQQHYDAMIAYQVPEFPLTFARDAEA